MPNVVSRRSLLKAALASTAALLPFSSTSTVAQQKTTRGIKGQLAPQLNVNYWIDGKGAQQAPFSIRDNRGKWIYLKCFQDWCPACHSIGFPNLQKLLAAFPTNDKVTAAVIQTTFEGFSSNNVEALRKNQLRYNIDLPFGHDPGNERLPREDRKHYPSTMVSYQTGGTPWVIIINPEGTVVFNDFHINIDALITYLKREVT